jgi:hypothetical protein
VKLLGDNIYTINKSQVGLEINVEISKYMLLFCHQNTGQNQDIRITNRSLENLSQFKYWGATVTNQSLIQGKIKS